MLQAATGVLTGDQIPTQQKQDLAIAQNELSTLPWMSKGERGRAIERLVGENQTLRKEVMRLKNKLLARQTEMINIEGTDHLPTPHTLLKAV
jgi:hypothetical protein